MRRPAAGVALAVCALAAGCATGNAGVVVDADISESLRPDQADDGRPVAATLAQRGPGAPPAPGQAPRQEDPLADPDAEAEAETGADDRDPGAGEGVVDTDVDPDDAIEAAFSGPAPAPLPVPPPRPRDRRR